jgi:hypothetical protein
LESIASSRTWVAEQRGDLTAELGGEEAVLELEGDAVDLEAEEACFFETRKSLRAACLDREFPIGLESDLDIHRPIEKGKCEGTQ